VTDIHRFIKSVEIRRPWVGEWDSPDQGYPLSRGVKSGEDP